MLSSTEDSPRNVTRGLCFNFLEPEKMVLAQIVSWDIICYIRVPWEWWILPCLLPSAGGKTYAPAHFMNKRAANSLFSPHIWCTLLVNLFNLHNFTIIFRIVLNNSIIWINKRRCHEKVHRRSIQFAMNLNFRSSTYRNSRILIHSEEQKYWYELAFLFG